MSYEVHYQESIKLLTKLDKQMRQVMKGFYRREIENKKMREAIVATLESSHVTMDQETRALLLAAVNYHPWSVGESIANRVADKAAQKEMRRDDASA
jgi:anthranilate/para-aminobenzoate synthase component II